MAQIVQSGNNIIGCRDPLANNYNSAANVDCNNCCVYGSSTIIGCRDPLAFNYDPTANVDCNNCCTYQSNTTTIIDFNSITTDIVINASSVFKGGPTNNCPGPFSIAMDGEVIGVNDPSCCNAAIIDQNINSTSIYTWDGIACYYTPKLICPTSVCVSCDGTDGTISFNNWNNTYIANHNGQGLQTASPILWQQIVNLITNSGQTIYVDSTNGEPLNQACCEANQGTFIDGICFCKKTIVENYVPRCISTLSDFLNLISTPVGYSFFTANFQTIGPSLGLTSQQINFILLAINSTADSNNNSIADLTEARLILSNALATTGGFYVNFGTVTNTPILVTKGICDQYGGFWDSIVTSSGGNTGGGLNTGGLGTGTIGTQVGTTVGLNTGGTGTIGIGTVGLGGQQVGTTLLRTVGNVETIITPTPTPTPTLTINGNCMCKPVVDQCEIDITQVKTVNTFDFFNNPIQTVQLTSNSTPLSEACCNRLIKDYNLPWEWQAPYCLATKRDDCLPITFSLNDKMMEVPPCGNDLEISMWVYFGKPNNPCQPIPDPPDTDIIVIDGQFCDITLTPNTGAVNSTVGGTISSTAIAVDVPTVTPTVCCYNINNPIIAGISLTDPILNSFLIQNINYNSVTDYFDRWVQIKATLPTSGLTLNFGVNLEIYQGLNCCCDYDIFVDDIRVNCSKQEPALIVNDIQCPGFNLTRVIDNKKSWVYNPGLPSVGISEYDIIERADGSFGMLNGEGTINRTFAPSLDADIPWRYTDYFKQSSVYEKHSNLVLNSKELWLTYDMCADCPISGTTLACPSGYTLSAGTSVCYQTNCISYNINNTGGDCSVDYIDCNSTTITTIIVSANTSVDVCSTVTPYTVFACTGLVFSATTFCSSSIVSATTVNTVTYLSLYELENYKKQFQSFWIPFMEQFIPATAIWVAGERWCNEVCTIINPCDYDFELVDSEVSYEQVPTGFYPAPPRSSTAVIIPTPIVSQAGNGTVPQSTTVTTTPLVTPVLDPGLTLSTPILRTTAQASIDIASYRSRFTSPTTVTIVV